MSGASLHNETEGETPAVMRYLFTSLQTDTCLGGGRSKTPEPDVDDLDDEDLDSDLLDDDFELSEEDVEELGAVTEKDIDLLDDEDLDLLEDDSDDQDLFDDLEES